MFWKLTLDPRTECFKGFKWCQFTISEVTSSKACSYIGSGGFTSIDSLSVKRVLSRRWGAMPDSSYTEYYSYRLYTCVFDLLVSRVFQVWRELFFVQGVAGKCLKGASATMYVLWVGRQLILESRHYVFTKAYYYGQVSLFTSCMYIIEARNSRSV